MSYGICLKCQLLKFYQGANLPEWDLPPGSAAQSRSVFQRWLPGTGESALCSQSCQLQTLLISRCTGSGAAASSGCSSCRRWQRCVAAAHRSSCPGRAWSAQQCRWAGSGTGWLPPRKNKIKNIQPSGPRHCFKRHLSIGASTSSNPTDGIKMFLSKRG